MTNGLDKQIMSPRSRWVNLSIIACYGTITTIDDTRDTQSKQYRIHTHTHTKKDVGLCETLIKISYSLMIRGHQSRV